MKPVVWEMPLQSCSFIPAGCLHWPIGEKDLLRQWVKEVSKGNTFTLLMGDSLDAARTHYRTHLAKYKDDDNSQEALDNWVRRDVAALAKELEPIKKRIAGVIKGNHYWEFMDGTNSEQYLCQLLGLRYLGPVGVIRVDFRNNNRNSRQLHQLVIYAHHHGGSIGGRTMGGDMTALERQEHTFDADIFVLSHTHKRGAFKVPKLGVSYGTVEPKIVERPKVFIRSGAFLKGYKDDEPTTNHRHIPSYAEERSMRPTDLGWVTLEIRLTHSGKGTPRVKHNFKVVY